MAKLSTFWDYIFSRENKVQTFISGSIGEVSILMPWKLCCKPQDVGSALHLQDRRSGKNRATNVTLTNGGSGAPRCFGAQQNKRAVVDMDVSKNRGFYPPNHPFLIGFSGFPLFLPSILGFSPYFWKHPHVGDNGDGHPEIPT